MEFQPKGGPMPEHEKIALLMTTSWDPPGMWDGVLAAELKKMMRVL